MKIVRGFRKQLGKPSAEFTEDAYVVSVGNFDGVHLGHQALLQRVHKVALQLRMPSVIVLFEPQPEEYFKDERFCPARLTRLREKIDVLQQFHIDYVYVMPFNKLLASLSATKFIEQILINCLHAKYLVVGDDFHFGNDKQGDFGYLQRLSKQYGFKVEKAPTVSLIDPLTHIDRKVSSTWVREALHAGDLQLAEQLLGRRYSVCGHVVHGDKRGRTIDFPTANIYLHRKRTPISGVYVVQLFLADGKLLHGVANIGSRPTIGGVTPILEVHLFDFSSDIYGCYVKVEFLQKLREEQLFASFTELKAQIARDVTAAKDFFG